MVIIDGTRLALPRTTADEPPGTPSIRSPGERFGFDPGQGRGEAARLARLRSLLVSGLVSRLNAFAETLNNFQLSESAVRTGLAVEFDPALQGRVRGEIRSGGEARDYYRAFSRGLDPLARYAGRPGTHAVALHAGGRSEKLEIVVEQGAANRDVLDALARAVNESALPVQAELIRQSSPGQKVEGLVTTGLTLALAANGAYNDLEVRLDDSPGRLLRPLDLRATDQPVAAPVARRYDLAQPRPAIPTTYSGRGLDPNAPAGLPAGLYTLRAELGGRTADVSVNVGAADTVGDVAKRLAARLDSSADFLRAATRVVNEPFYDPRLAGGMTSVARIVTEVTAKDAKPGDRLRLSEDVAASPDGASSLLARLGLNVTATPGADAELGVNGRQRVRNPGLFLEDKGRLAIETVEQFGGRGALRTTPLEDFAARRMAEAALAYNDLNSFLRVEADLWKPALAASFEEPLRENETGLAGMGLRLSRRGDLVIDDEAFERALRENPERGRKLLAEEDSGLVTRWRSRLDKALTGDPGRFLVDPLPARLASRASALDNDLRSCLWDALG